MGEIRTLKPHPHHPLMGCGVGWGDARRRGRNAKVVGKRWARAACRASGRRSCKVPCTASQFQAKLRPAGEDSALPPIPPLGSACAEVGRVTGPISSSWPSRSASICTSSRTHLFTALSECLLPSRPMPCRDGECAPRTTLESVQFEEHLGARSGSKRIAVSGRHLQAKKGRAETRPAEVGWSDRALPDLAEKIARQPSRLAKGPMVCRAPHFGRAVPLSSPAIGRKYRDGVPRRSDAGDLFDSEPAPIRASRKEEAKLGSQERISSTRLAPRCCGLSGLRNDLWPHPHRPAPAFPLLTFNVTATTNVPTLVQHHAVLCPRSLATLIRDTRSTSLAVTGWPSILDASRSQT